jgi:hypothetical protein
VALVREKWNAFSRVLSRRAGVSFCWWIVGFLFMIFMYVCMYGLSFDFVKRSDYIVGVTTTCLRLAQLVGAAFT